MAIIGWPELVLILVILIFLFGAARLKGLAKGLGDSVREFKQASSEEPTRNEKEEAIIEAAKKLGIDTGGKDINQIISEMNEKVSKS